MRQRTILSNKLIGDICQFDNGILVYIGRVDFPLRDPETHVYDYEVEYIAEKCDKSRELIADEVFATRRDVWRELGRPCTEAEILQAMPLAIAGADAKAEWDAEIAAIAQAKNAA